MGTSLRGVPIYSNHSLILGPGCEPGIDPWSVHLVEHPTQQLLKLGDFLVYLVHAVLKLLNTPDNLLRRGGTGNREIS